MIYHASSLAQLREAIDAFEQTTKSKDTHVGTPVIVPSILFDVVTMDLVIVDKDGNVVGDEANDNKPDNVNTFWRVRVQ